jgi:hypothetical protein
MTITEVDLTVFFSLFYVVVFFCPFFFSRQQLDSGSAFKRF